MLLTTVPRRATLDPALRTRARTTLPKLPSPISFKISNRSSKAAPVLVVRGEDNPRDDSYATVMVRRV
jgi:hypothetical protein